MSTGASEPFFFHIQCDAIKQCPDGRDEVGCRECAGTDLFSCTEHPDSTPCIASTKVSTVESNLQASLLAQKASVLAVRSSKADWCKNDLCVKQYSV